jgi:rhomboid protease GluP
VSPFRTAPVITECLVVCAALFIVCQLNSVDGIKFRDAQRFWGAVVERTALPPAGAPEVLGTELHGPFDLWAGEWWRIPVSAFHHAHLLHLLMNCVFAWDLGRRLEKRWGSVRFFLFMVPAVTLPLLLEILAGNIPVGFSGAICAMLGAQIALQNLGCAEEDIPEGTLLFSLGVILAGIPATGFGLLPLANLAHVSGVVYGALVAWLCCGPWSNIVLIRLAVVAAHLMIWPAVEFAMHPFTNGRYLWYRVDHDPQVPPDQRTPLLERAIQLDPSLTGIWLRLIEQQMIESHFPEAWKLAIEGLSSNPSSTELMEAARRVWRRLAHGPQRDAAEQELRTVFGERSTAWLTQIRGKPSQSVPGKLDEPVLDPRDFPIDRPMEMEFELPRPAPQPVNRPDAIEGTSV